MSSWKPSVRRYYLIGSSRPKRGGVEGNLLFVRAGAHAARVAILSLILDSRHPRTHDTLRNERYTALDEREGGERGRARTCNRQLRRLMLYPIELLARARLSRL